MVSSLSASLPMVGIPACVKPINAASFHAVNDKYIAAVSSATGALPVLLPALGDRYDLGDLVDRLDGILFTGSPSNVEPHRYGGPASVEGTLHDAERDATTLPLIRAAVEHGVPIFCICRGIQELNVALGGTLHQRVQEVEGKLDHRSRKDWAPEDRYNAVHQVSLSGNGYLRSLLADRPREAMVNSLHSQGIDRLAPRLAIEATAPDGLIEAVRVEDARAFALGVQWHPEHPRAISWPLSQAMFRAFGAAVAARAAGRHAPPRFIQAAQ
ncbi:MAG: gamma-glutamyl-gamma-aminobutyrate hydrolase family protein [Alphaproteobacteria bacterium]|nr:gamma-glutamyl-gamma-aminobutyrate hydrolase family protein [Alphaproteobacteria bacterium]